MGDGLAQVISALIGSGTTITLAILANKWATERARRKYERDDTDV